MKIAVPWILSVILFFLTGAFVGARYAEPEISEVVRSYNQAVEVCSSRIAIVVNEEDEEEDHGMVVFTCCCD